MSLTFGRSDRRFIYRINLEGLGLLLLAWGIVVGFALLHGGANWPWQPQRVALPPKLNAILPPDLQAALKSFLKTSPEERDENNITIFLLATLLLTKTWGMYRRTTEKDGLAWSVIASNLTFAALYFYLAESEILPGWSGDLWLHRAVRVPIIVISLVTLFFINTATDDDSDESYDQYVKDLEARVDRCEGAPGAL